MFKQPLLVPTGSSLIHVLACRTFILCHKLQPNDLFSKVLIKMHGSSSAAWDNVMQNIFNMQHMCHDFLNGIITCCD